MRAGEAGSAALPTGRAGASEVVPFRAVDTSFSKAILSFIAFKAALWEGPYLFFTKSGILD